MAKQLVQLNNTSRSEYVFIQNSSSTTGAGLTGLTYLSAGMSATYVVERGTPGSLSFASLTNANDPWVSGGFIEVSAALLPGVYRYDVPNIVFQTADKAVLMIKGATNMAPVVLEYQIVAFNPDDSVRLGLTALPNASAGAAGGLPTGNASGQVTVAGTATGAITSSSFTAGAIDANAIATDAITSAELSATAVAEIADGILARKLDSSGNETSITATEQRTVRAALRYLRNKVAANTATMTVYQEDDTTQAWTSAITADATAAPITISDPT